MATIPPHFLRKSLPAGDLEAATLEKPDGAGQREQRLDISSPRFQDDRLKESASPAAALGPVMDGQRAHLGQSGGIVVKTHTGHDRPGLVFGDEPVV